ncbi:hypothetical protein HAX54_031975, partial [Datura stramonium]|nr:hypothetical protein [Datura stramonium]
VQAQSRSRKVWSYHTEAQACWSELATRKACCRAKFPNFTQLRQGSEIASIRLQQLNNDISVIFHFISPFLEFYNSDFGNSWVISSSLKREHDSNRLGTFKCRSQEKGGVTEVYGAFARPFK